MNSLASAIAKDRYECVVLDDDPDIRVLIARVLSKIGVSSLGLASAEALERVMKEQHPAVVFLDVHLDRSDAIDGIRVLKQGSFNGAVQLISGKDPTILLDIKAVGERNGLKMLDPLQKPFRSEELRRIFDADANGAATADVLAAAPEAAPASSPSAFVRVDLEEALDAHWLDMAYQPKVDLLKNVVIGAEGLARINHPVHGNLGPQSFLPGASAAALNSLTEFVVKKAFLDWEVLMGAGRNLRLAVNAPAEALIDPSLVNLVREHHPRNSRWPGLIMEVTEEEAVRNFDAVAEAAVQLKIYKVALAIDDFGSGYSSFARLKQFPFAEIKLDRSYVQGCATDPMNASICQSIVELARATGADCVAEGIEEPADRDALIRLGCDLGQGYLFGRPMSVGKLIERTAADFSTMLDDRGV
jgi:EAL domain-containing protein (putative c-di-GMP-specific phosphodiesterase class I)/ActR/RegA family two-component response regulator